jgi:tetratricopeptide (TPR) repeat protein
MAKTGRKPTPSRKSAPAKPKTKSAPARTKPAVKPKPAKPAKVVKAKPKVAAKPHPKPVAKAPEPAKRQPAPPPARRVKTPQPPPPPVRRSTYVEAVAMYERGVQLLQARKYKDAASTLERVISQFPEEKELHERAKLYILVCQRSLAAAPTREETADERVFSATLAINNGQIEQAVKELQAVIEQDPEHDHATYMLGVAHAQAGNTDLAVQFLSRAMALNIENRELVRKEPDLEPLRRTDAMIALLASPPPLIPRREKRAAAPKTRR